MSFEILSEIKQDFISTPTGTAPAGSVLFYFKSDGNLYKKVLDVETLISSTVNETGPVGFLPSKSIVVVLNGNAPANWSPVGLESDTQAFIITGTGDSDIDSMDRSLFSNGKSLILINAKNGNSKIKIRPEKNSGTVSNRFSGEKDIEIKRGANMAVVSVTTPQLNRWSPQIGKQK